MTTPSKRVNAFTLVEMLAVLGIIVVLLALLAPAVNTIVRGPLVTQAADTVAGIFNLGRQTAIANNQSVEVRFYQYGDPSVTGQSVANPASGNYRAIQLYLISDNATATPVGAVVNCPQGIIADSGTTISTLLAIGTQAKTWTTTDPQVSLPRAGTSYNCCVFRFRPDGSTNLPPTTSWFITLHNLIDGDGRTTPPPNYVTIQVDPTNGESIVYRP